MIAAIGTVPLPAGEAWPQVAGADPDAHPWQDDLLQRLAVLERTCIRRGSSLKPEGGKMDSVVSPPEVGQGWYEQRMLSLRTILQHHEAPRCAPRRPRTLEMPRRLTTDCACVARCRPSRRVVREGELPSPRVLLPLLAGIEVPERPIIRATADAAPPLFEGELVPGYAHGCESPTAVCIL